MVRLRPRNRRPRHDRPHASRYDTAGRQFVVRTDRRCDYARKPLPAGEGTLCGIVEYFNGRYRLRITNHEILFDRQ